MAVAMTRRQSRRDTSVSNVGYTGISSDAVNKATGRTWAQWLKVMDAAGCRAMTHRDIAALLHKEFQVGPWWGQMVAVGYEQARGLREKHQTASGYSINASRTLNASAAGAYLWWTMARCRAKWLGDADIAVHKATPSKSLRATWNASTATPAKSISVNLYPKGKNRTTMTIEHSKLRTAAEAKRMKSFWSKRLDVLSALIDAERG